MKTVLFQGDSITDAGRNKEDSDSLGYGYPLLVAGRLGLQYPGKVKCLNRGVSGDRIVDVYARIKADIINLKPDVMTLLIGINDVWHELAWQNGVSAEKFKKIYTMLLEELREALPNMEIILIEPFVLKGEATAEKLEAFRTGVAERAAIVRKMGEEFSLTVVPMQADLDRLEPAAPTGYWLKDGVHPTCVFHQYMADKLVPVISEHLPSIGNDEKI